VVTKLWDSWEDDALVIDKASGLFADDDKIHAIDYVGRYFRVAGPLNIPRSPQGRPVYIQAGSSDDGRSFAARYAEAIFTAHQTLASAQEFYRDIKTQAALLGRNPDHVKILPGISPFIASSEQEANRLEDEFNDLIQPEYSLGQLQRMLGVDLSRQDLDAPFPRHLIRDDNELGAASRFKLVLDIVDREKPTLRQLIQRLAGGRGHLVVAGTPEQIADKMEAWFNDGAADGFNVMPPYFPGGFDAFATQVVPILQRKGLFRLEYAGTTLREHLGLPRPDSQFAQALRETA
jgi:FMN-dependent oxidoreductase (nitrilotriacetate monooxygenase family)